METNSREYNEIYTLPLITVITPIYKDRSTIFDAINSILIQTYPAIQYILVDDGPNTINDAEIENYVKSKTNGNITELLILHNDKNLGTVMTLNKGMRHAKGKYIFNLADDDCFFDETVLVDWVKEFLATNADIMTAKRALCSHDLSEIIDFAPTDTQIKILKNGSNAEIFEAIGGANFIFGCATARTKKLFEETGGYDENYRLIEDYSSNMQLLRKGYKIYFFDRTVVKYRIGGISVGDGISAEYLKESNKLFKKEVLPYVKNKTAIKKQYNAWKDIVRYISLNKVFNAELKKADTKIKKIFVTILFMSKHPLFMLKKTVKRIKRQKKF